MATLRLLFRNRLAGIGLVILCVVLLISLCAPLLPGCLLLSFLLSCRRLASVTDRVPKAAGGLMCKRYTATSCLRRCYRNAVLASKKKVGKHFLFSLGGPVGIEHFIRGGCH